MTVIHLLSLISGTFVRFYKLFNGNALIENIDWLKVLHVYLKIVNEYDQEIQNHRLERTAA